MKIIYPLSSGPAGNKNDQSRKHEMTKTRKEAKKDFVFSPPKADVFGMKKNPKIQRNNY